MKHNRTDEGPMSTDKKVLRLAAVADIHCTRTAHGAFQQLFSQITQSADLLLLCGDLTDHGLPEEAQILARELTNTVKIPVAGVLGNHDYHSGKQDEVDRILSDAGVRLLDGDDLEVCGVGFAGVKGFGGGFDRHTLEAWGEDMIKKFVHEAVEESLKLETALSRLSTPQRIAVLHYAPIQGTVEGEPPPIYPFLGSSRLEEPINRYQARAVFHGHAHHGSPEGKTRTGVPVYNVSVKVLKQAYPDRPTFRLLEIPVEAEKCQPVQA